MRRLVFVFAVISLMAASNAGYKNSIKDLAWMTGSWSGKQADGMVIEENYSSPDGGVIMGTSRMVVDGKAVHKEFISLEETEDGGLVMNLILPNRKASFKLTEVKGERSVWEDPANAFPSKIIYSKKDKDTLVARLEGKPNGKDQSMEFVMKRVKHD